MPFMRRFLVTAFVLLYAVLTVWGSQNKTQEWIRQEAGNTRHTDEGFAGGKKHTSNTEVHHRRILEEHYVVEPLQETTGSPLVFCAHAHFHESLTASINSVTPLPARAPPSLI